MSWTILRHALYTDNLLNSLPNALASGTWATATDNKGRNSVTREDCAQADAAALAASDFSKRIYDITGPAPVTAEEVARMATELTGKPLKHVSITKEQLAEGMKSAGLPPTLIGALVGFDVATARGYHATVSPAVQDLTGSAPTSVRDFLTANKAALMPKG
jgi:NAD(P)H dehydrogenase (quinone)